MQTSLVSIWAASIQNDGSRSEQGRNDGRHCYNVPEIQAGADKSWSAKVDGAAGEKSRQQVVQLLTALHC